MIGPVTFRRNEALHEVGARVLVRRRIRRVAAVPHREPRSGGRDSRFGRRSKASVGRCGRRQARWSARDLFLRLRNDEVWMLTLYAKNVADNIPAKVLKKIKEEIDAEG